MNTIRQQLNRVIDERSSEWLNRQIVWLGDMNGQVLTDVPGVLYARQLNGKVIEVYNMSAQVPPTFDLRVEIGRSKTLPTIWQIIAIRESYDVPAGSGQIAYHHTQHEFPNGDTVWADRKQIIQLTVLVYDAAGFIVQVFGALVQTATGIAKIESQQVNLSSYKPTEGALYASIETNNSGVLSVHVGTNFGVPALGASAFVPVPSTGKYMLAFALLYAEQVELTDDDIRVPMPLQGGGAVAASGLGWINVMDYGATGDGTTDDTAAITSAIGALPATGGVLYFPPGDYKTSGGFTLSTDVVVMGMDDSGNDPLASTYISRIKCTSPTASLFTVNADNALFRDITLVNTAGSTPSAGAGITVTSSNVNQSVSYDNIFVSGFYVNIDVQVGVAWVMHNSRLSKPVLYALKIRNTVNPDAGDWAISDSYFAAVTHNPTAGIRIETSGGGKISNCKFNGTNASQAFAQGIDLASSTSSTGILIVSNCSIENVREHGIKVSGSTWNRLIFANNQFGLSWSTANNTGNCININGSFNDVAIVGNVCTGGTTPAAISLTGCDNIKIVGNVNDTFSSLVSQSGCTNVVIVEPGTTVTAETAYGQATAVGSLTTYAREDHTHGSPALATATPADVGSSGAAGSGATPSKYDHVHRGVTSVNGQYGDVTVTGGGGSSAGGHLHGLARWNGASGQTTFELPDIAEYIDSVMVNGLEEDPLVYSLSSNRTQIVLDTALPSAQTVHAHYVIAQV